MEVAQCTAVDRVSSKMYFCQLKSQYQFKCMLYLEYFHCFTIPLDSFYRWKSAAALAKYGSFLLSEAPVGQVLPRGTQEFLVSSCPDLLVCLSFCVTLVNLN